jgi:hypothetical protein
MSTVSTVTLVAAIREHHTNGYDVPAWLPASRATCLKHMSQWCRFGGASSVGIEIGLRCMAGAGPDVDSIGIAVTAGR